jgi:hypothetical protein
MSTTRPSQRHVRPIRINHATEAVHSSLPTLNIALLFVALGLIVYYVVTVNTLASDAWRLRDSQSRLSSVRQDRDGLVAQEAQLEDRTVLQQLVTAAGMVPAGTVSYVMESSNVAAAR